MKIIKKERRGGVKALHKNKTTNKSYFFKSASSAPKPRKATTTRGDVATILWVSALFYEA